MHTCGKKAEAQKGALEHLFHCMSGALLSVLFKHFLYHSSFPPLSSLCNMNSLSDLLLHSRFHTCFSLSLTWHLILFSWGCLWCRRLMSFMGVFLFSPLWVACEYWHLLGFIRSWWMSESLLTPSRPLPLCLPHQGAVMHVLWSMSYSGPDVFGRTLGHILILFIGEEDPKS